MKSKTRLQHEVRWWRDGWLLPKKKKYFSLKLANRLAAMLGPEPWKALGREPDEYMCCWGGECGCGGLTVKEALEQKYKDYPKVIKIEIHSRTVTFSEWKPQDRTVEIFKK